MLLGHIVYGKNAPSLLKRLHWGDWEWIMIPGGEPQFCLSRRQWLLELTALGTDCSLQEPGMCPWDGDKTQDWSPLEWTG